LKRLFFLFFVLSLLMWVIFGKQGIYSLWKMEKEKRDYEKRIKELEEENSLLIREIERLRNDQEYILSLIRKELRMIKENEVILYFKK